MEPDELKHAREQEEALDAILGDVDFLAERRSFVTAAKRFGEFLWRLESELQQEERRLSARGERMPDAALAAEVGQEHRALRELLGDIGAALSRWDYHRFCVHIGELERLLAQHHRHGEDSPPPRPLRRAGRDRPPLH